MRTINVFFDTEFTGLKKDCDLISIGLCTRHDVNRNFNQFYCELEVNKPVNDWIQENVIRNMLFKEEDSFYVASAKNVHVMNKPGSIEALRNPLRNWFEIITGKTVEDNDNKIQLYADCGHYDMVLFIDIFGSAFDIPSYVSPVIHDFNQCLANKKKIKEWEAFDLSRHELLEKARQMGLPDYTEKLNDLILDAKATIEGKSLIHNAMYDALVLATISNKRLFED
ncbi:MAG: 3'-5' exoribonuclease [Acholeplasmatales bacterium]|nr:3'-5' exoribonuclease [Acholeplasmatales bacterium]